VAKKATNGKTSENTSPTILREALSRARILLFAELGAALLLMPRSRLKLHSDDLYAYGAPRGGIDERWFASTTAAANEGAAWMKGSATSSTTAKRYSHCARRSRPRRRPDRPRHLEEV